MANPDDATAAADRLMVAALVERGGVAPDVAEEALAILARQAAAGDAEAAAALRACRVDAMANEVRFLEIIARILGDPD